MNATYKCLNGVRRWSATVAVAGLVASAGCSTLDVESLPAPGVDLAGRTTFRILMGPPPIDSIRSDLLLDGDVGAPVVDEPVVHAMINNPIVEEGVREQVRRAFEGRGYRMVGTEPAFDVRFSATAVEKVDEVTGAYPFGWGDYCCYSDEYTEGTVIIDVLDSRTGELLWRGSGEARVSEDPDKYVRQVNHAIRKVIERYPRASWHGVPAEGGQ